MARPAFNDQHTRRKSAKFMSHSLYDYYATRHTRRKDGAVCVDCGDRILIGETYLWVRNLERFRRNQRYPVGKKESPISPVCNSCFNSYEAHEDYVLNSDKAKAERAREQYRIEKTNAITATENWNSIHPIGTKVLYQPVMGENRKIPATTRSAAYVADCGMAAIFLKEVSGFVLLSHVTP
jgi:hypothetical protein